MAADLTSLSHNRHPAADFGNVAVSVKRLAPTSGFDVWIGLIRPAVTAAFVGDHPGCMLRSVVGAELPT